MKSRYYLIILVLFSSIELFAYSDVYYIRKTIIKSVQACGPVTVDAAKIDGWGNIGSYKKYSVSSGTTWNQRIKIKGGYDCNGTNLKIYLSKEKNRKHYPSGVRYGNSVYHYVEYETYYYSISTGSGSYGGSSSNTENYHEGSRTSSYDNISSNTSSAELGKTWANAATATSSLDYSRGYKPGGFSLAAGISYAWGENLEMRFRYGSSSFGGDVTALIGHDWIKPVDGINWNVGIGMYFGGRPKSTYLWDIDLGVKMGKSSYLSSRQMTMMMELNTTHLFGPEHVIGVMGGVGLGLAGNNKPDFAWDVRCGIVIYFMQWNWF